MKILLLDIETSPHSVYAWGLFKQNISLSQVKDTSRVLCSAYKWLGERKTNFTSEWTDGVDGMLEKMYNVIEEADAIVTYNGNRFDLPTLNKEFLLTGYRPPAPYKSVDLYRTVKNKFRFASNKLDHVAQQLGLGSKTDHYGFQMWLDVMDGNKKAQKLMETYNKQDVVLLEKVYDIVLPWIANHPNRSHHSGSAVCPNCGSKHLQHRGFTITAVGRQQRFQCQDCGKWSKASESCEKTPKENRINSI
jgi:DNA polymerase elongation subunit (family B)